MITVCTTYYKKAGAPATALVRSCKRFGIRLQEFGTGNKHETFLKTKLIPLEAFVGSVKTSHVMFVDGNDTFFVSGLSEIAATYERLAEGRVLIGSELQAWPYKQKAAELKQRARAKGAPGRYMFIDNGLIMGPTSAVASMLQTLIASVEHYREQYSPRPGRLGYPRRLIEDDVGLMVLNLCDGKVDPVIDYGCQMICALKRLEEEKYRATLGGLHCLETGSHPHIVHCNGNRRVDRNRLGVIYKAITGDTLGRDKVQKRHPKLDRPKRERV